MKLAIKKLSDTPKMIKRVSRNVLNAAKCNFCLTLMIFMVFFEEVHFIEILYFVVISIMGMEVIKKTDNLPLNSEKNTNGERG